MYNTEDVHSEIRLTTVNKIISKWVHYKDFMVDLSMFNGAEDYKNLLSLGGKYGGSVELTFIRCLFSNYLLRVHNENSTNAVDYSCVY